MEEFRWKGVYIALLFIFNAFTCCSSFPLSLSLSLLLYSVYVYSLPVKKVYPLVVSRRKVFLLSRIQLMERHDIVIFMLISAYDICFYIPTGWYWYV